MRVKVLAERDTGLFAVILDKEDEVISQVTGFAQERMLTGAHFTGIGAFRRLTLGYFDPERLDYKKIPIEEQVEVLSLVGNIAIDEGKPKVHAHVVVGKSDGTARGGHILEATVWPTLELVLEESPGYLHRRTDPETGLPLIRM